MKYLGIDYGTKWIGLAVSDDAGSIAFPRAEIENDEKAISFLVHMAADEKFGHIIVGDTRTWGGEPNAVTEEADRFVIEVAQALAIPVERANEAWTSQEAARFAPKGEHHNNAAAAAVILQRFLDMHKSA